MNFKIFNNSDYSITGMETVNTLTDTLVAETDTRTGIPARNTPVLIGSFHVEEE